MHVDNELLDRATSNTVAGFGWVAAAEEHLGAHRLRRDDKPEDVANSAAIVQAYAAVGVARAELAKAQALTVLAQAVAGLHGLAEEQTWTGDGQPAAASRGPRWWWPWGHR